MVAWAKTQVGFTVPDVVDTPQAGVAFPNADEPNPSNPLTCTGVESLPDVIQKHGFKHSDAPGA